MKFRPQARPLPGHLVGRYHIYGDAGNNSDLIVVAEARDSSNAIVGDFVVPRRFTTVLPEDYVGFNRELAVAPYVNGSADIANLGPHYIYVRIVDQYSHPGPDRLKAGYVSEVIAVPPGRHLVNMPNVGEFIYHYPNHTIHDNDDYAFVLASRPLSIGHDFEFPAIAIPE